MAIVGRYLILFRTMGEVVRIDRVVYGLPLREVLAPLSMTNYGRGRRRGEPRLYGGAGTVIRSASSCNPLAERGLSENQLRACRRQSDFLLLRSRGLRSHRLCIQPRRRAS